jgi:hypothetical protein
MANMHFSDQSLHHSSEHADHNDGLSEGTMSGAIGARNDDDDDDDMIIVGADGLQLFEMNTGTN